MKYIVNTPKYENVEGSFIWPFLNGISEVEIDIQCDFSIFPSGPITFFCDVTSCKINTNGHKCFLVGNGLLFKDMEYVSVEGLTFKEFAGDGIQLNNVKEYSIRHNSFVGHSTNSDEAISSVKGAGSIRGEIAWNLFDRVHKGILCGTGDAGDETLDVNQNVFIHHNWFHDFERRAPYCRCGTFYVYNNLFDGWKFKDTQTFCIWAEDNAELILLSNSFKQCSYNMWDGFPRRQMSWFTRRPWCMDQGAVARLGGTIKQLDNMKNQDWIKIGGSDYQNSIELQEYEEYSIQMEQNILDKVGSRIKE